MKLVKLMMFALFAGSLGCVNVQPVGPMVKVFGDKPLFSTKKSTNMPAGEVLAPAPKPVPPSELVQPDDVTREDAQSITRKLQSEFETDRKTMPAPPRTAEISIYKNGQKVQ